MVTICDKTSVCQTAFTSNTFFFLTTKHDQAVKFVGIKWPNAYSSVLY